MKRFTLSLFAAMLFVAVQAQTIVSTGNESNNPAKSGGGFYLNYMDEAEVLGFRMGFDSYKYGYATFGLNEGLSSDVEVNELYFGYGLRKRAVFDNSFLIQANIWPYLSLNLVDDVDFSYGASAQLEVGLRVYTTKKSKEDIYITVGYDIRASEFETEGMFDNGRWQIGLVVLMQSKDFMKVFDQRMYASIDAAKMLGVKYAVLHPNTATLSPQKYKEEREHKKVVEHIAPYVDYANKIGVVLLIENMRTAADVPNGHRYCQSPNELCAVADELGIDVCWDFGHANISGVKQSEALTYIGKRLKHIHVNDNLGIKDDHLLPFMGNVDWRDAMHGLSLAEYDGTFMMELGVSKIPESMRVEYAKCVVAASNELLNYIV